MPLVYPIYLDTPMMMGFLASLEGGIIEELNLESKVADTEERSGNATVRCKLSNILSLVMDVEGKGEFAKKFSELLESNYKSTVKFPNASLFIRLYDILKQKDFITSIHEKNQLENISLGDIVEVEGLAVASPVYQMRNIFNQLFPILQSIRNMTDSDLDQKIIELDNIKPAPGAVINLDNVVRPINSKSQKEDLRKAIEVKKKIGKSECEKFLAIGETLDKLVHVEGMDVLLIRASNFNIICYVYPSFARNERIQDIYDANWNCIGKVIKIISSSDNYDFFKGSPLSYLAKNAIFDFWEGFKKGIKNEKTKLEITETNIEGPTLIIAPLAIYI